MHEYMCTLYYVVRTYIWWRHIHLCLATAEFIWWVLSREVSANWNGPNWELGPSSVCVGSGSRCGAPPRVRSVHEWLQWKFEYLWLSGAWQWQHAWPQLTNMVAVACRACGTGNCSAGPGGKWSKCGQSALQSFSVSPAKG